MRTATPSLTEAHTSTEEGTVIIAGHPPGLRTLFFTEMWERASFYGMKALLVLYMTAPVAKGGLEFPDAKATGIYGIYGSSVYMTNLLGGWLADRYLGARRAVLWGGIVIACGHFSMALGMLPMFYAGLCLIAAGTGLLKPNISTMVGALYEGNEERRDAGFSIFYMGINLGAFIAPLACGYLGQKKDWHYGFAAAGVGMVLGLVQYVQGGRHLGDIGLKANRSASISPGAASQALTTDEAKRLAVIAILLVFSSVFFMALEQAGSSLNLFADRLTRNSVLGLSFPSSWFQSVNPIFVIALSPVFAMLWTQMGARQPTSSAKFAWGLVFAGLGFVIIAYASSLVGGGRVSPGWLILVYLMITLGELCLSPVGLGTVTRLAPTRMVGSMMGMWFLSIALGNYVAGAVAGLFKADDEAALVRLFGSVALVTIGAGCLLGVLTPLIKRLVPRN